MNYKMLRQTKGIVRLCLLAASWAFWLHPTICPSATAKTRGIEVTAKTPDGSTRQIRLYSGYYALVVGCGDYRSGWPRLPNPVQDAREVARTLREMGWKVDLLQNCQLSLASGW